MIIAIVAATALLIATRLEQGEETGPPAISMVYTEMIVGGDTDTDSEWTYPDQSRIVLAEVNSGVNRILTNDFESARATSLSFDAQHIVFSARRNGADSWQIWEMNLRTGKPRQVTSDFFAATDPAYLPDDRIIFAATEDADEPHALFVCNRDGSGVERITFHPVEDRAPVVLPDGRLLFVSGGGTVGASKILSMRYDGSGAALYFKIDNGGPIPARPGFTADRSLFFIRSEGDEKPAGLLSRVSDARPLNSHTDLATDSEGRFHSLYPISENELLVSFGNGSDGRFGIHTYKTNTSSLGLRIQSNEGFHAVEPVPVVPRERPMGFVSAVSKEADKGWLFCLNADLSTLPAERAGWAAGGIVRVFGADGPLGDVPVEADGSFYVELPADTPLRFQTLDVFGQPVRGPSSWIWVRPGVQRGCIGCHENREVTPENRVPLSIKRPPSVLSGSLRPAEDSSYAADVRVKTAVP